VIDFLFRLPILFNNLAVTSSVNIMTTGSQPELVNQVTNSPSAEKPVSSFPAPVFGQVTVSVANSAATAQANLPVYAYRVVTSTVQPTPTATATPEPTEEPTQEPTEQPEENIATLTELVETGISGTTDANGQVTMTLPEGNYRFRADQYDLQFWSDTANHCAVPTCAAASVTVLGADYTTADQTIIYTYDPLNRLTATDYDSGAYFHYTYDAAGNRTAQDSVINTNTTHHTYAYDNANRLTAVDSQAYAFDANGNLLSDGVYTYTYDSARRTRPRSAAEGAA
jgi:YD repeat-containing protein